MKSMEVLKSNLATHQGGLSLLFQKADTLQTLSEKTRSPDLKASIAEMLEVVEGLNKSHDKLIKACVTTTRHLQQYEMTRQEKNTPGTNHSISTQTVGDQTQSEKDKDIGLQTPFLRSYNHGDNLSSSKQKGPQLDHERKGRKFEPQSITAAKQDAILKQFAPSGLTS